MSKVNDVAVASHKVMDEVERAVVGKRSVLEMIMSAVLAGGQLFGFFGVLLALPVAAVILVGLRHTRERYLASDIYGAERAPSDAAGAALVPIEAPATPPVSEQSATPLDPPA